MADARLDDIHVVTIMDVTMQRRTQEEVFLTRARADREKHANVVKTEVMQMLSRELRTPLQGIIGVTSVMLEEAKNGDPDQLEMRTMVMASARLLLTLINNVLDSGKIDADGQLQFHYEAVPVQSNVDEVMQFVQPFAQMHNAQVVVGKSTTAWVNVDPLRMQQILINLVSNAVRYSTNSGVIEVTMTVEPWSAAVRRACSALASDVQRESTVSLTADASVVTVRDHGPGLPIDQGAALFSKFSQLQGGDVHNQTGTGLGLNLCYRFIREMGGHIWADNSGCDYRFYRISDRIAFHFPSPPQTQAPQPPTPEDVMTFAMPQEFTVMIVDDNSINLRIVKKMLQFLGAAHIGAFTSAEAALKSLESA
ncbi:unnamed protein product, partial [Phaeothamnion confervicola]